EIAPGLPKKTLPDGTQSQVQIIPFYDRSGLIYETLGTLNSALIHEILVTLIVVLLMVMHLRSSILISSLLPLAVLICFIAMKAFHVDANVVALSGIAIAIGTMVDMGIIVTENILRRLSEFDSNENRLEIIYRASSEVGSAVVTAIATTVVSFLPVFTMVAAEGKLFRPLAFTKTFALLASVIVALTLIPPIAHILFRKKKNAGSAKLQAKFPAAIVRRSSWMIIGMAALVITIMLTRHWVPLGPEKGLIKNLVFVGLLIGGILGFFRVFLHFYPSLLRWCLGHKALFLTGPALLICLGLMIWLGVPSLFGWLPRSILAWKPVSEVAHLFPGLGKEFMPPLDEGSYLYMPTTMPHAGITEALDMLQIQDRAIAAVPEVDEVVGKIGRVESSLDPAPVSMIETVINYRPKYILNESGRRITFRFNAAETDFVRDIAGNLLLAPDGEPYMVQGRYQRDESGDLIPQRGGRPFRLWRPALDPELNPGRREWEGIEKPDDIWDAIIDVAQVPGSTSAPKLQPISTRIVMLQSGMRAPMGVKVKGPDLESIEQAGLDIERLLKEVPSVAAEKVFADRIVGKPYLEIEIDRTAASRYGVTIQNVQEVIEYAIGGKPITTTVEGRERYGVRVRYMRELRDSIEGLERILIDAPDGAAIPLAQLADIKYVRGPQMIKSEDTFLIGYVLFDGKIGFGEVNVVEQARDYLDQKIATGELELPSGVSYSFAGSYENQVRAEKKLMIVLPLSLFLIVMILYLQFRSISTTTLVFSGIAVAWAGGFILLWLYARPWFIDISFFGVNMRELFQVHPVNLSVAVWVGFLALFGIASDDGVVIATYLNQSFAEKKPSSISEIREMAILAGCRRVRPCLMTTATTIIALIPVLSATGRGADVMVPMAIPSFGGMSFEILTMFVVPVLYTMVKEIQFKRGMKASSF
ncbi:MAG: efflux RND transporter permease subunit, partial [Candidatus Eisenbacteria bacterium]|nr:efflux RND transporter permease subunit [Candidatus Eisenbacteria bacterium]